MDSVTREEVNGLGNRVSNVEKLESRVKRNEKDIQDLWRSTGEIKKDFNSLAFKILFMVSVPTLLVLWQIVTKP